MNKCNVISYVLLITCLIQALVVNKIEAATEEPSADTLHKIEAYVEEQIKEKGIPGASIAIVSGSKTIYAKGFGVRSLQTNLPVTEETTFNTGSIAKNMTSTAILQLRDQGKLKLDDPVQKYIPEFGTADPKESASITIRQLLTHTAGLGYQAQEAIYWGPLANRSDKTMEDVLPALLDRKLLFEPGQSFAYSNVGYGLLGLIIKRVSGESYPDYVKHHILQPLGMNHTAVVPKDYGSSEQAQQYIIEFMQKKPIPRLFEEWGNPAGMGWATTPSDWAEYVKAQLGEGKTEILSSSSRNEAHFGGIPTPMGADYSMAWFHKKLNGTDVVFHQGGGSATIALIPEKKLGLVFMGNVLSTEVWNIGFGATAMLMGEKPGAIFVYPDVFGVLSKIWTAMALLSIPLWIALGISISRLLRRKGSRSKKALIWRALLFSIVKLVMVAYLILLNQDVSETPNFFGSIYGFYVDQFVGVGSFTIAVSLWTVYSIADLLARITKKRAGKQSQQAA